MSNDPTSSQEIALLIRAVYDHAQESVGIDAQPSTGWESADDPRAKVEILAAIAAKANHYAADLIRDYPATEERKQSLYDHYAGLKEQMLEQMLNEE